MPLPENGYTATKVDYDIVATEGSNAAVVKIGAEAGAGITDWQDLLGAAVTAFRGALEAGAADVSIVRTIQGTIQDQV